VNLLEQYSLPLLTKELIEQANNKRTYILRVVYAVVLYGAALFTYSDLNNGGVSAGLVNLGKGRAFFQMLVAVQAFAIVCLLPAITCGALTVEKEKDTLALLLLTKLSPWTIVFEKLVSRVLAMGTYQLLSLPLFAIVYGMGGVELNGIIHAVVSLLALTIIVASVSILCSTWFRTTAEAFIVSYSLLFLIGTCITVSTEFVRRTQAIAGNRGNWPNISQNPTFWHALTEAFSTDTFIMLQAATLCLVCMLLASRVLFARAFVPPRNLILELFQRADRFFNELNESTTGGIVLVPDRATLPLFHPIAWRETGKKSLGTFRYQFRILMLLLAPLVFVIAAILSDGRNDFTSPFRGFPAFFWSVSVICLTIHATGVIAAERIRQTLDVLLVSPLTSAEIVLEKVSGVRRLIKILTIPFAALVLFQAIWTGYVLHGALQTQHRGVDFWLELVTASLVAIFYMPIIMWFGFLFGLRLRNQIQAILATFTTLFLICVIPIVLVNAFHLRLPQAAWLLIWTSPLQMAFPTTGFGPGDNLFHQNTTLAWVIVTVHFTMYGIIWRSLRRNALQTFSKVVRRMEPSHGITTR
jgi:ABC-type transport system involved in multi-copper enzyme maturation permease subunit